MQKRRFAYILLSLIFFSGSCSNRIGLPSRGDGFGTHGDASFYRYAESFLGIPYRLGGEDRSGMDCSGLVVRLYKDVYNIPLPHRTSRLFQSGTPVTLRSLKMGDLVFFREERGQTPTHVGIWLGDGSFIHATVSKGVCMSELNESYYRRRYAGARRILE